MKQKENQLVCAASGRPEVDSSSSVSEMYKSKKCLLRPDPQRDWDWLWPHTQNLSDYCFNDPVNAWDPMGFNQYLMIWSIGPKKNWAYSLGC